MSEFLLDTSYLIDLVYENDDAVSLHEEISGRTVTATVCIYELAKFVESDLDALFGTKEVMSFSQTDAIEAGTVYRELHDRGDLLGEMDTVISGIARNRGLTL
ncbi:MAG TPA: type II toxin-antitoxin system VapC family toxin, partial [Halococcus sp.]|nr:type II toxin-antitoxin system VapC family toxin [Halococcus sp.]